MHDSGSVDSPDPADSAAADAAVIGRDRHYAHPDSRGPSPRSRVRALLAFGGSVVCIGILWRVMGVGPLSLILLPLIVLYVVNVYLGGGLNQSPLVGIDRIRRWRIER